MLDRRVKYFGLLASNDRLQRGSSRLPQAGVAATELSWPRSMGVSSQIQWLARRRKQVEEPKDRLDIARLSERRLAGPRE